VAESIPAAGSLEAVLDECADGFYRSIDAIVQRQAKELANANAGWLYECNPDGSVRRYDDGLLRLTTAGKLMLFFLKGELPDPVLSQGARFRRVRARVARILGPAAVGRAEPPEKAGGCAA
jgi:hypothetical protein